MRDTTVLGGITVVCITVLGITYFIVIKQDSSVLFSLASVLGGILGYVVGKRRTR